MPPARRRFRPDLGHVRLDPLVATGEPLGGRQPLAVTDARSMMSARSHDSTRPANGPILRGWVPFAASPPAAPPASPAPGTSSPSASHSPPRPRSRRTTRPPRARRGTLDVHPVLRMQDHRRDHLRCSRPGSRRNEGWSSSQGRQRHSARTPASETQMRRPTPVTSLRPAQQDARPALAHSRPVHHIRPYAIRQQRLYADTGRTAAGRTRSAPGHGNRAAPRPRSRPAPVRLLRRRQQRRRLHLRERLRGRRRVVPCTRIPARTRHPSSAGTARRRSRRTAPRRRS